MVEVLIAVEVKEYKNKQSISRSNGSYHALSLRILQKVFFFLAYNWLCFIFSLSGVVDSLLLLLLGCVSFSRLSGVVD